MYTAAIISWRRRFVKKTGGEFASRYTPTQSSDSKSDGPTGQYRVAELGSFVPFRQPPLEGYVSLTVVEDEDHLIQSAMLG